MPTEDEVAIRIAVKNARKANAELRRTRMLLGELDDGGTEAARGLRRLNDGFSSMLFGAKPAAKQLGSVANRMSLITAPAIGMAGAAGLGAGALVPLAGAAAALPVAGVAAAQGLGVMKLATMGVTDAIGGLNGTLDPAKLAALTPAAQRFAQVVQGLKPAVRGLRADLQEGLFTGLTRGLESARGALGVVRAELPATAAALGGLGQRAGTFVQTLAQSGDLGMLMQRNAKFIQTMGATAFELADAFRHVLMAAGPLTDWLLRGVHGWSRSIANVAAAARESGGLASFFAGTREVLSRVFSITGSLAGAFWDVGKALAPLGGALLVALDKGSAALARFTGSLDGGAVSGFLGGAISWVQTAVPTIVAGIGKVVGRVLEALKPAAPFFSNVLLPLLKGVAKGVIGGLVAAFNVAVPAIGFFARVLGWIGRAAAPLRPVIEGIGQVVGFVFAGPILKGISLLGKFGGVVGAVGKVAGVLLIPLRAIGTAFAWLVSRGASVVGFLVGRLGGAWRTVISGAGRALGFFTSLPGRFFGATKGIATSVVRGLGGLGSSVLGAIRGGLNGALSFVRGLGGRFFAAGKSLVTRLVAGVSGIGKAIAGVFGRGLSFAGDIGHALTTWLNASTPLGDRINLPSPLPDFTLPALAAGGLIRSGGYALVGERGPEIVALSAGSAVLPNLGSPMLGARTAPLSPMLGARTAPLSPMLGARTAPLSPMLGARTAPLSPMLGARTAPPPSVPRLPAPRMAQRATSPSATRLSTADLAAIGTAIARELVRTPIPVEGHLRTDAGRVLGDLVGGAVEDYQAIQ